jgi:tetratricopeptide (TPR) repeat protein
MRRVEDRVRFLLPLLLLGGCAPKGPQHPPEIEAALRKVEHDPNDAAAYLEMSRAALRQKDFLRARQYLAVAERAPGRDVMTVFRLGVVISVRSGQYDDAVLRCHRYLEKKEDPEVRLLLSAILEATGDLSGAEVQRQVVIAARPDDLHQLIELARFYQRSGTRSGQARAAETYRRYLAKAPAGEDAPQARAALLEQDLEKSVLRRTN